MSLGNSEGLAGNCSTPGLSKDVDVRQAWTARLLTQGRDSLRGTAQTSTAVPKADTHACPTWRLVRGLGLGWRCAPLRVRQHGIQVAGQNHATHRHPASAPADQRARAQADLPPNANLFQHMDVTASEDPHPRIGSARCKSTRSALERVTPPPHNLPYGTSRQHVQHGRHLGHRSCHPLFARHVGLFLRLGDGVDRRLTGKITRAGR